MYGSLLGAVLVAVLQGPGRPPSTPVATPWPEPTAEPEVQTYDDDPLDVRQIVLENGLTVLLSENHERPEVFGAVVVRTGAKNDPADNTGMAHYLEHMLFKGTTDLGTTDWAAEQPLQAQLEEQYERLRTATPQQRVVINKEIARTVKQTYAFAVPNEIDQLLEQLGGTGVNAFTSYDETVYHNRFPASALRPWLEIYAHRFVNPVFRLFPTELEAVYEEKNIAIDTTGYQLFRGFMQGAFPGHPYGRNDILGEVEHLKRPSLRAMREYFSTYYVPGNMALVLSGDFEIEQVVPWVRQYFGAWPVGPKPEPSHPPVKPFRVDQRLSMRRSPVRVGAVAYRTVPESHPDYPALQVIRRLLSNEQRSGFVDQLSDRGKVLIAYHVPADLADHNLDVVAYVPRILTQSFRNAERLMTEQIDRVARGDFDDKTFEGLKDGLVAEQNLRWEDNRERALAMAHAFVIHRSWEGHVAYLRELKALTKAQVQDVARRLFGDRRLVLRSRMGFPKKKRLSKPKYPPVTPKPGAHSEFFNSMQERTDAEPKITVVDTDAGLASTTLAPGVTLVSNPNPFNDLYHLEFRFGVGTDAIRELDLLEDYLGRIGTKQTSGTALRRRLFERSTTLEFTAELDRFIVRLQGPQKHLEAVLGLLAELMVSAKPARAPLRQLRREIWGFRRIGRKDASTVAQALRDYVLYDDKSAYLREYGPVGAGVVRPKRLISAWRRVLEHEVEIGYVGNADPRRVGALLEDKLRFAAAPVPAKPAVVYPRGLPDETTVYFVPRRDAVQTHLWFAVDGAPVSRDDVPAADALSVYFGSGMAGLVFQEVREFRALAYAARGAFERDTSPTQSGYLVGYIGSQADKTFESLDVMLGLISNMPRRPARMSLVRSALVRSQETQSPSFRDLQETIDRWSRVGYREDPRRWLIPAYQRLEFDDIMDFYDKQVAGRPVAIMVVGDPRKVKQSRLRTYGRVVRVREGKLFSP